MKLPTKNQAIKKCKKRKIVENRKKIYCFFDLLHPRIDNPKKVNSYAKHFYEIKTDAIDPTDGLKLDIFEKLEGCNNLNLNHFDLNEDKTLTQLLLSKKMSKSRNKIKDIHEEYYKDNHEYEYEIYVQECKDTIDLGSYQDHFFLIKEVHIFFFSNDKHQFNNLFPCRNCMSTDTTVNVLLKERGFWQKTGPCVMEFPEDEPVKYKKCVQKFDYIPSVLWW